MGFCIVEKVYNADSISPQNKKVLEVQYYNKMFLNLLQINLENEEEIKPKDILKIFKEFVFYNEEENSSPFSNGSGFDNKSRSNNYKYKNEGDKKPRNTSKELIEKQLDEVLDDEKYKLLNKSKDKKDNFNININANLSNNNNNLLNISNSFKNSNSAKSGNCNNRLGYEITRNLNSSSSLKFVSRKSNMLRALDLNDVLMNYFNINEINEMPEYNFNSQFCQENKNIVRENTNSQKKTTKPTYNLSLDHKINFLNSKKKTILNTDSDKENIKIRKINEHDHKNNKSNSNLNNYNIYNFKKTKIREVKEFRFMRQNFIFSVRIQEINNFLVLIFENLDEEKKQIQNNLIKTIKSQYIITISHELNNPLNGLIHCIEELDFDEEEKKRLVVKKIKRFKFMIKFFLKNIITNFKFFLNEPIQKKPSNISFGFILESIKRSLFEFYEYKNINILHDFSNLNNVILQYDYFYFRYLLKNIFMYFYYKIPRNGNLIIEIEKERDVIDINRLIMGKDTSEFDSDTSNQSQTFEKSLNKKKLEKKDGSNSLEKLNKSFNKSKSKSINNESIDVISNNKLIKKKITMTLKTEQQNLSSKKNLKNIFDKASSENFDIENSVQTLEMLIESINKISKLLGIKIDFSNFDRKNISIQINLNYYIDKEDFCSYDNIEEYSEEYEKYKANCVFSINRTLINEEKKIFLNPTLNMKFLGDKNLSSNCINNFNKISNFKIFNQTLNIGAFTKSNPNMNKNYDNFDLITEINPIAPICHKKDDCYDFKRSNTNYSNHNIEFENEKLKYLSPNKIPQLKGVGIDYARRGRIRTLTCNSMNLNLNDRPSAIPNNLATNSNTKDDKNNVYSLTDLTNKKNDGINIQNINIDINNSGHRKYDSDDSEKVKNKSGYFLMKEKGYQQNRTNNINNKEKYETSLFSKQNTTIKNSELVSQFKQTIISENVPKILISQYEIEKEKESAKEKDKFGTEIISMRRQNIFIEEALENESNLNENSDCGNFIRENLKEETLNDEEEKISSANLSKKNSSQMSVIREKAFSENIVTLGSSRSNSIYFNNSMNNYGLFSNDNYNDSQDFQEFTNLNNNLNKKFFAADEFFNFQENIEHIKAQNAQNSDGNFDHINEDIDEKSKENKNQIFINTYNTYLNIDNVEKLNVISSSIQNKNNIKTKNDLLKKYCNIDNKKNDISRNWSSESNKLINANNNDSLRRVKSQAIKLINEIASKKTNINDKPIINKNKKLRSNLKTMLKNIENNINPSTFNFNQNKDNSSIKEDIHPKTKQDQQQNSKGELNENELNENYDTYDQNSEINTSKTINLSFAKKQIGYKNPIVKVNYIRSPRLFFHCKIPKLNNNKRRDSVLSRNSSNKLSKKKCDCNDILLVDDELFNLSSMNFLIKKKQLTADTAINGKDSIQKIEEKLKKNCTECLQTEYKLIFMDILMPEMDGIEASKVINDMIKKKILSQNIKILVLTAHDSEIVKKRAGEISIIKEFVNKPVKKSVVEELLNKYYFNFGN